MNPDENGSSLPVAHFMSIGGETRNEAKIEGNKCEFIGEFNDFGGGDRKRKFFSHRRNVLFPHAKDAKGAKEVFLALGVHMGRGGLYSGVSKRSSM